MHPRQHWGIAIHLQLAVIIPPLQYSRLTTQKMYYKQGVALTGRNSTGLPWSVTDDDRHQRASLVCPPTLSVGRPVIIWDFCNEASYL